MLATKLNLLIIKNVKGKRKINEERKVDNGNALDIGDDSSTEI